MSDTPDSTGSSRPTGDGDGSGEADKGMNYSGNTPPTGETSAEAAGSIRDRLRNPGEQSTGGDTRSSEISVSDFQQTDSRTSLHEGGTAASDEGQRVVASGTVPPPPMGTGAHSSLSEADAKRHEKVVSLMFLISLAGTIGFVLVYFLWDFEYGVGDNTAYTPLLGVCMAAALGGIGFGAVYWAKTLMEDEEVVQERHAFGSKQADREATVAVLKEGAAKSQLGRRPLLRGTLLLSAGALAVLPVPLLFSLGKFQNKEKTLAKTGWGPDVRLIRKNGTPVNKDDLEIGAVESVYPDIPRGTTNSHSDSPALLIRMRPEQLKVWEGREDWSLDGYVVYSSICSHLGCPVKLYEQQTHHLLCPCHQSTFAADDGAKVLFGPAARPLPQLAIYADDDGYFFARGDFAEPVGPSYWERKP